ncbi:MAG: alpha/beta hydrolase [Myxococcales bacterium]|nr:alpha/beta hydrolase [Myxococcales bacterium]
MSRLLPFALIVLVACGTDDPALDATVPDAAVDALVDSTTPETTADVSDATEAATEAATDAARPTVLRVHYPAGTHTVSLRGSVAPLDWTKGLAATKTDPDTWVFTTEALTTKAEWKPLLDDATWSRGPNYSVEPGTTVDVYPHFTTTKGTVEKRWTLTSKSLGNTRGVWVYLPPTYLENTTARLPVVYLHDGQNLFDPALAFGGNEWKVDETMDAAAETGKFREAIVVGPENTARRIYEYTPTKDAGYPDSGGGALYLSFLIDELKPKVDGELRTLPGREHTVLMGSSLGGLISSWAGTQRADVFGLVGAMSPSTWWDSTVLLTMIPASKTPLPLRAYVDSGDSGASSDDVANTAKLADAYRAKGFVDGKTLEYVVQKGATHSEVYWAQRLPHALEFLLGPR